MVIDLYRRAKEDRQQRLIGILGLPLGVSFAFSRRRWKVRLVYAVDSVGEYSLPLNGQG